MAGKKGALDSIKAGISGLTSSAKLGSLTSRLPFAKRSTPATPEPFSTIEDDTPLGDLLSSQNAAPQAPASKAGREKLDIRGILESVIQRKSILVGLLVALSIVLVIAVVAIRVSMPPNALKEAKPFTKAGETLVKSWLPPPGDPLQPRVEMQREGVTAYTAADAARLGRLSDPGAAANLAEKNDEAIEDLYGTVP